MSRAEDVGVKPIISEVKAPEMTRVLIVDDHRIVREGLSLTLAQQSDFDLVGEASDSKSALAQMEQLHPDIAVIDIGLPDRNGLDLSQEILRRYPKTRIVILSGTADQSLVTKAVEAGISGYLLKLNAAEELVRAIRAARKAQTYMSPEVSAFLLNGYKQLRNSRKAAEGAELTEREREVLKRIAEGQNTKQIAAELHLSAKTVETHRGRLMKKLGVNSVAELTKYAIRFGYTSI